MSEATNEEKDDDGNEGKTILSKDHKKTEAVSSVWHIFSTYQAKRHSIYDWLSDRRVSFHQTPVEVEKLVEQV